MSARDDSAPGRPLLRVLERVSAKLTADGWSVTPLPPRDDLPGPLRDVTVDAVAHRGTDARVVVVLDRGRDTLGDEGVRHLVDAVAGLPGWELTIEWAGDVPESAGAESLRERLRSARSLLPHDPESALLLIWSSTEGAMLALALSGATDRAAPPPKGLALANAMHDRELLTDDELGLLRRAQHLRRPLAHGRRGTQRPSEQLLEALGELAERLLAASDGAAQAPA